MLSIGIDIGGMSIKIGLVDENGKIVDIAREKIADSFEKVLAGIEKQIDFLLSKNNITIDKVKGIGIGCPGMLSKDGIVEVFPNLGWKNAPLVPLLKERYKTEVRISNDANVATLAEVYYGVAKDYNDVVMFTLGTGVGGGVVIDKKLFEGGDKKGTELGHTTLILGGAPCKCGRRGCLESYVSATALIRQTKAAMNKDPKSKMWDFVDGDIEKVDGRTAFECSKTGDKTAIKVIDKFVAYLSDGIMNMLNIFRPQAFIIGGGISGQGDYLIDKVKKYCKKYHYGYENAPKAEIFAAKLGNDAGIIGAAALLNQ